VSLQSSLLLSEPRLSHGNMRYLEVDNIIDQLYVHVQKDELSWSELRMLLLRLSFFVSEADYLR